MTLNKIKTGMIVALVAMTQFAFAANETAQSIDANSTREAIGMDGITLIPLTVLIVFLIVLGFATQKIPGLKS